jgi:nitrate reductase alpha subunit
MHPFIHPLGGSTYEAKSDWEIFKAIAKELSSREILGRDRCCGLTYEAAHENAP